MEESSKSIFVTFYTDGSDLRRFLGLITTRQPRHAPLSDAKSEDLVNRREYCPYGLPQPFWIDENHPVKSVVGYNAGGDHLRGSMRRHEWRNGLDDAECGYPRFGASSRACGREPRGVKDGGGAGREGSCHGRRFQETRSRAPFGRAAPRGIPPERPAFFGWHMLS